MESAFFPILAFLETHESIHHDKISNHAAMAESNARIHEDKYFKDMQISRMYVLLPVQQRHAPHPFQPQAKQEAK